MFHFRYFVLLVFVCACGKSTGSVGPEESPESWGQLAPAHEEEQERSFQSPSGVQEQCVILAKIPGGDYSKKDVENEGKYCAVDFYVEGHALCPKTWSTSPATMVYSLKNSEFTQDQYEKSQYCGRKNKGPGVSTAMKFKMTMNASGTSGTLSQSSLLYYHFSRYFDTKVKVPVAVYREMDRKVHLDRVSLKGLRKTGKGMIGAGWKHLVRAEQNLSYTPKADLFTADDMKVYGSLLRGKGERYGSEFNGTRASGWGKGQNRDFQKTPGFLALRASEDLLTSIEIGIKEAAKDKKMRRDLVGLTGPQGIVQVAFWMRELVEITLMDFIFSQQDRVGNIDYRWYWAYIEGGETRYKREKRDEFEELSRQDMEEIPVPEMLLGKSPILLQRTNLNDNDAGGRVAYANFTKSTGMLTNLRHYSAKLYKKLIALNKDLQDNGPIHSWLKNNVDLTDRRLKQIVKNTELATSLLREQCELLRFDLDDVDEIYTRGPHSEMVNCNE